MSRKIYTYEECHRIAKQCTCSSDMQKLNGSAYNMARKYKWLDDYTWFVRKQHKPYTYDEVYEIAKNYNCSVDFQKGNGSAYGIARKNNWIKDYTWFIIKHRKPYTYDECYAVAKTFKSRLALARGNVGVYQAALNHGWLDDYTWFESKQKPFNYWTKERVIEESKKYKSRGNFHDNNATAYSKARVNGWLDELVWLKDDRIDFSKDKIDCVYAYEFTHFNAVYIGRTLMRRIVSRDREHIFNIGDSVCKYAKEKNVAVPKVKILQDYLTVSDGVDKEALFLEQYRKNGWNIINKAKTGSIGLIGSNKWNKKTCYKEALKYKNRSAFAKLSAGAYEVARRNGWLDTYSWFEEKMKPNGYWSSYENCYNAALKCRNISEFIKLYSAGYVSARNNNWLKDFNWLRKKRIAYNKKWDKDTVYIEAKKYKSRSEFAQKARGAYKVAISNGWVSLFDWFEDPKIVHLRSVKDSKRKIWTYDKCNQVAVECNGRHDFRKKYPGAYSAAWKNKWLDQLFQS